jgi:pentose-5-phosphate-3-epimerase
MNAKYVNEEYPLSEVTARIIAAAKEVHKTLGPGFEEVHFVQAISYLKASGHKVGLSLNFGAPILQIRRLVN